MIKFEMKTYNLILTGKQQEYPHYHRIYKQLKKYYLPIDAK